MFIRPSCFALVLAVFLHLATQVHAEDATQSASTQPAESFVVAAQANPGKWVVYDWPELESTGGHVAWSPEGLAIDCRNATAQYGVASWLGGKVAVGAVLRCRVQIKTQGNISSMVGVAYHRASNTDTGSRQGFINSPAYQSADWKEIEWETPLASAPHIALVLYASGQGQVWFKGLDVRVEQGKQAGDAPKSGEQASTPPPSSSVMWKAEPENVAANEALFGRKVFHLIRNVPLPIKFRYRGDKSALKAPALLLDLPEGISVAAARCSHPGLFKPEKVSQVAASAPGRATFRVENLGAMTMLGTEWGFERASFVFLLAKEPVSSAVLRYAESDGNQQSPWKSVDVEVLPELKDLTGQPVLSIIPWNNYDMGLPGNGALLDKLLHAYSQAGMHTVSLIRWVKDQSELRTFEQKLLDRGLTGFMAITDILHDPLADAPGLPQEQMTSISGKSLSARCPSYAIEDQAVQKAYFQSLDLQLARLQPAAKAGRKPWAALDLELWGDKMVKTACFDQRCRELFAKRYKLSGTPSAQDIVNKHSARWADFRRWQTAAVSKLAADYIRRTYPGMVVAYYDYVIPLTKREEEAAHLSYPADTRLYDDDLDVHLMSFYRPIDQGYFDLLAHATSQLRKPVVPVTMINNFSKVYSSHSPRQVYMEAMAAALLGSPGLSVWDGMGMDGAYLAALNQAQIELLPWASFIQQGKPIKAPAVTAQGAGSIRCILRQSENQLLLAVFNYATKPAAGIQIQSDAFAGYEGSNGNTFLVPEIKAQTVLLIPMKKIPSQPPQ